MSSDEEYVDYDEANIEYIDSLSELELLGETLIAAVLDRKSCSEIETIINAGAPTWYQDSDGWSALHAAANIEDENIIELLLKEGAPWNIVDNLGNSPGDIALSLNNETCYALLRDAGIRSELILQLLPRGNSGPQSGHLKATDDSALGSSDKFLSSQLRFTVDDFGQEICLLKTEDAEVGVMMGWERELMRETVQRLCSDHERLQSGLKVLNIGFGLGIIDSLFQNLPTPPLLHVIIEPHPDVLKHMQQNGWHSKPGVNILEGKWQEFVGKDVMDAFGGFDVVYTDTFSEDYDDLRKFFKQVPNLLADSNSRFSFFNGLGATNAVFYDVYTKLAEINLADLGFDVEWYDVDVDADEGNKVDRWGRTREYFSQRLYRLPVYTKTR